jgi:carbon monoxide dehydrogenase subunit G
VKLTATYAVPASRERVFSALTDPAILQRAIPGCESFEKKDDGTYAAKLRVGIGSVSGVFAGTARMDDVRAPEFYTLAVDGRGATGWAKGRADMTLAEAGATTSVSCNADVTVGGVIAAVGSRLIEATAKRLMGQFFERLSRELQAT